LIALPLKLGSCSVRIMVVRSVAFHPAAISLPAGGISISADTVLSVKSITALHIHTALIKAFIYLLKFIVEFFFLRSFETASSRRNERI
jgi:hypothetical protein